MSNVVQFLEALASNPKPLSADELTAAVASARLQPAEERAIREGDVSALSHALGGSPSMLCIIVPAENDEPQEDGEQDGESESPESDATLAA